MAKEKFKTMIGGQALIEGIMMRGPEQDAVVVTASAYARSVEIVCEDGDVVLEDNYFDLNAESRRVRILRGEGRVFTVRSVYDIGRERS